MLTLNLTKSGSTTSIVNNIKGEIKWERIYRTTKYTITSKDTNTSEFISGSKSERITYKQNIDPSFPNIRFIATGEWVDPTTGLGVPFSASIDIGVTSLGESSSVLSVYCRSGSIFYNEQPNSLTVNADLYKGGSLSSQNKQFFFFKQDSSVNSSSSPGYNGHAGIGWKLCSVSNTPGMTPNVGAGINTTSQGVLTVTQASVINSQTFLVVSVDSSDGNKRLMSTATIIDFTDPIIVTVESTAGDVFKNSMGTTTLKARLFRNGEEIDTDGRLYTYKWSKRDSNGTLVANYGSSNSQYKTGKTISVNASEVSSKATYICEVESR